jgi:hypothetical protein
MKESWTDERLDDFARHVDHRFDGVDHRFEAVEHRFDEVDRCFEVVEHRFNEVDRRLEVVDHRFDRFEHRMEDRLNRVNDRFDALHRVMLQVGGGVIVALIGLLATQL